MQAVFFLDGKAVDLIQPLKEMKLETIFNSEIVTKARPIISDLLDQFELRYPGTFQAFKAQITSGDHFIIEQAINKNGSLLIDFLNQNKSVKAYSEAMNSSKKPLATLQSEYFPNKKFSTNIY